MNASKRLRAEPLYFIVVNISGIRIRVSLPIHAEKINIEGLPQIILAKQEIFQKYNSARNDQDVSTYPET